MIREDFAGPGGWDQGLRMLGHRQPLLGVEANPHACATALAAGHARLQADVTTLDPADWYGLAGYIGSPVCKPFAQSGPGASVPHLAHLSIACGLVAAGAGPAEAVASLHDEALDGRCVLSLEPMRFIAGARPRWVALEQVPKVLPLWETYAVHLRAMGYSVWTGKVRAEAWGTPQVRERATLLASLDRTVVAPQPTHSRFHRQAPARLDPGVAPWVTMTAALGRPPVAAVPGDTSWADRRPSPAIVGTYQPEVVAAPGYRKKGDPPRQRTPGSVLVSLEEAGVLQGFPRDYPWRGPTGARWQQVGDAIPPPLAAALLGCLL